MVRDSVRSVSSFVLCHTSLQNNVNGGVEPWSLVTRDKLIWQIEEYLYPTSILGMIYHIRADAFIFFGL